MANSTIRTQNINGEVTTTYVGTNEIVVSFYILKRNPILYTQWEHHPVKTVKLPINVRDEHRNVITHKYEECVMRIFHATSLHWVKANLRVSNDSIEW